MQIKIDFRLGIPIYLQIMNQVKQHIATGALLPGDQLPTVRQLAADLRVNFNTVARAYRLLDEAGIISTQHGRGTYILGESTPEAAEKLRRQALDELTHHYLTGASRMGFSPLEVAEQIEHHLQAWQTRGAPNLEP